MAHPGSPNLGFYHVFANVTVSTASRPNLEDAQLRIMKNNTIIAFAEIDPSDTGEEGSLTNQTGTIVQMNGTSDFFIVQVNIDRQTSSPQIIGGSKTSFFYGYRINI